MSVQLGRGLKMRLSMDEKTVTKVVSGHERHQPFVMRQFPNVFCPVLKISELAEHVSYQMPRLQHAPFEHLDVALLTASPYLEELWARVGVPPLPTWQETLAARLRTNLAEYGEGLHVDTTALVAQLVVQEAPCVIHGDPTFANLLHDGTRYYWIDPLTRPFIPGDPHVDLGKLFQSCFGYEYVLVDREPVARLELCHMLATHLNLDGRLGYYWCLVHFIRLLPYQLPHQRRTFLTWTRMLALQLQLLTS